MKRFLSVSLLIACLGFVALTPALTCTPSQQTITYNTLAGTEDATSGAYKAYMQLVLQGQLPTNNVPQVSDAFREFQVVEAAAVSIAAGNTNAIAGAEVTAASIKVLNAVNAAKAKAGIK